MKLVQNTSESTRRSRFPGFGLDKEKRRQIVDRARLDTSRDDGNVDEDQKERQILHKPKQTRAPRKTENASMSCCQHWPMKLFFGNGCLKSSFHVVKFGFAYASGNLIKQSETSVIG